MVDYKVSIKQIYGSQLVSISSFPKNSFAINLLLLQLLFLSSMSTRFKFHVSSIFPPPSHVSSNYHKFITNIIIHDVNLTSNIMISCWFSHVYKTAKHLDG